MDKQRHIKKEKFFLRVIFLLSLWATVGSLYYGYFGDPVQNWSTWFRFSRLNGLPPCDLCRYMRVFQYPLLLISGVALRKHDKHAWVYMLPLSVLGFITGIYKYLLEIDVLAESWVCSAGWVSCSEASVMYGGFISLALLWSVIFLITWLASRQILRLHKKQRQ